MSIEDVDFLNSVLEATAQASSDPLMAYDAGKVLFVNRAFQTVSETFLKTKAKRDVSLEAVFQPDLLNTFERALTADQGDTFVDLTHGREVACYRISFTRVSNRDQAVGICSWRELAHGCGEEFTCERLVDQAKTLQKKAEHALQAFRESEEKFRVVAENARAVFGIVQGTHFVYANPYLSELSGYTNEEILSMHIADLLHPESRAQVLEFASKRQAGQAAPLHYEFAMVTKSGEKRWMDFSPARITYNGLPAIVGTAFDITDRKRAQELLIQTEKLASVGRMAATIAHEINNPLEAVMNCLFLARTAPDHRSSIGYLDAADDELKRIAHITQQALGFYRESSKPTIVPAAEIMESAFSVLKNKIKAKHVHIEKQYANNASVFAVPGELRQVLANLLSNSLEAVDEQGSVRVRISAFEAHGEPRSKMVRITVADDGKGIPAAVRPHIFEPLFTTRVGIGTGLGLWVSREIMSKYHGSIRVHSQSDGDRRGTTFSVVLPAA